MSEKENVKDVKKEETTQELLAKANKLNQEKIAEAYNQIKKILDENGLMMKVEHTIKILNK